VNIRLSSSFQKKSHQNSFIKKFLSLVFYKTDFEVLKFKNPLLKPKINLLNKIYSLKKINTWFLAPLTMIAPCWVLSDNPSQWNTTLEPPSQRNTTLEPSFKALMNPLNNPKTVSTLPPSPPYLSRKMHTCFVFCSDACF
jgi:hypothetical protein